MYTINITGTDVDKVAQRRTVYVSFIDGDTVIQKQFSFGISDNFETIKKIIYTSKIELETADLQSIPTGVVDVTPEPESFTEPTQAELDKQAWQKDRELLRTLMELVRDGVFTGTEKQITDLQAKVRTSFKPTYLD